LLANDGGTRRTPGMRLTANLEADAAFLRELHHRLRNNFQTITSLISLQARTLPQERRGELRFVEEHVQAMAAAYRSVGVTEGMVEVGLAPLVTDVMASLRQIAGLAGDTVELELATYGRVLRIDQAIALGLYLAALVPPYFEAIAICGGSLHVAVVVLDAEWLLLSVLPPPAVGCVVPGPLRQRLGQVYLRQLGAELEAPLAPREIRVRILAPPLQQTGGR
jgi:hypothetical protein